MINYSIGESNLYFRMYLNFKDELYLIKAFNVHYDHTMILCIEHNIYFKARKISESLVKRSDLVKSNILRLA